MLNYIKGEMYRLIHKKGNYLYFAILYGLFSLLMVFSKMDIQGLVEGLIIMVNTILPLFFGIHIFMAVFTDDLSSKTLPGIISTGLSRWKLVLSKFFVAIIYSILVYAAAGVYYIALSAVINGGLGGDFVSETMKFIPHVFTSFLLIFVLLAIGSVVVYTIQKSNLAITAFIVLALGFVPLMFNLIGMAIPVFNDMAKLLPTQIYQTLTNDLMISNQVDWTIIAGLVGYAAAGIVLSTVGFAKVEVKGE